MLRDKNNMTNSPLYKAPGHLVDSTRSDGRSIFDVPLLDEI
jgi:hypothetical protein